MLSLASPWYLLGLALLPLIYWLHRSGRHRRALPVAHLALWRQAGASLAAAGRRPPDPAWRRRALLATLMVLALAEPQWPGRERRITLWVDDSLSMLTRRADVTRLARGLDEARALLAGEPDAEVELRKLSDPWHTQPPLTAASVTAIAAGAGSRPALPPPAALLRRDRRHWLITDSAHRPLLDWPGGLRPDRLIDVGAAASNVGIERIAARRQRDEPGRFDLLAKVTNGGATTETRELVFFAGSVEVSRSTLRLEPGQSALVSAAMPAAPSVRATLHPGDALPEDDALALDLAPLRRRRVAADAACPRPLAQALGAHPALAVVPAGTAEFDVQIDCGQASPAGGVATLRVIAERAPLSLRGSPQWSAAVAPAQRLHLDARGLQLAAKLSPRPGDAVWLAIGDAPAIVRRASQSPLIEAAIDFSTPQAARDPKVPLLLNWLVERLVDAPLLDAVSVAERPADASRVLPAPRPVVTAGPKADTDAAPSPRDGARPLLLVAALVLAWEIVALARQWFRLSAPTRARAL